MAMLIQLWNVVSKVLGKYMVVGTGGAPEGVLAAAALKCVGGDMQARLKPETEEEIVVVMKWVLSM